MQGYQLTFFTEQDRKHAGMALAEWLVQEARKMGLGGATVIVASEGFGRGGKLHSAHFFELADQPVEITIAVNTEEAERLLRRLREERIRVFYVKAPIEFGMTDEL